MTPPAAGAPARPGAVAADDRHPDETSSYGPGQVPDAPAEPGRLEAHLRARRDEGRKLLLPYVTAGYRDDWPQLIEAFAAAGADAIEVGIPFSDPVMDGPTIQEASALALASGITPPAALDAVAALDVGVPLIAMTYYNLAFRAGHERFATSLAEAGISAAILPDLPLEEVGPWAEAADAAGVETVLLAAPTGSDERIARVAARARGFVYGVGLVGITGERATLAESALVMARRLKEVTDKPVLIGIGVSSPEQAAEVAEVADGVVVASAIIRRLLEGGSFDEAVEFVAALRAGLDGV
ncbi:MAG TPA: tryptophan synthase subunit alpha [Acidimicrobiales bacterium]|nr:tryptophan synthase subunit alpha [Acidimicrobiales bacterium]